MGLESTHVRLGARVLGLTSAGALAARDRLWLAGAVTNRKLHTGGLFIRGGFFVPMLVALSLVSSGLDSADVVCACSASRRCCVDVCWVNCFLFQGVRCWWARVLAALASVPIASCVHWKRRRARRASAWHGGGPGLGGALSRLVQMLETHGDENCRSRGSVPVVTRVNAAKRDDSSRKIFMRFCRPLPNPCESAVRVMSSSSAWA